jgi:hypothetical protein
MIDVTISGLWGAFQGLGALAGLFATGNIFWRWITKGWPSAVIDVQPLVHGSTNVEPILRVSNNSERPMLLAWDDGVLDHFRISKDDSTLAILRTLRSGRTEPPRVCRRPFGLSYAAMADCSSIA